MRMRTGLAAVAMAAASLGTVVVTAPAASADPILGSAQLRAVTDDYLFNISISTFLNYRSVTPYITQLDWTSDGCSSPLPNGNKPGGFNFLPSCQRHDFGYRNYKKQGRFTEYNRGQIDNKFRSDMYNYCGQYSGLKAALGVACRRYADAYYAAVRNFGA
ncbi:phospholipase [Acrocarpospora catenulata]|uniref:phospholipase n=1 Tax=Acrocarpospora catenulata TaxID=2836182 RepID=UPI001BD95FC0|nr:phospholipase [Acrocarpospora catenulata]